MSHIMGLYKCQSIQCHHSQFMAFRLCFQLSITLCNKGGQISAKKITSTVLKGATGWYCLCWLHCTYRNVTP